MSFFTVYSPQGDAPAKREHGTHGAALHEAHRLATANPGRTFYVMRSCSKPVVAEDKSHG